MSKRDKKTKKKLRMVYTSELKLLEKRYEDMSKEGWMIEKVTGTFDRFIECEPQELDFSVSLFQPELPIDYPNQEKHETYLEFCEDSGWKFICHNNLFYVYSKSKGSDVVPIHTDSKSEFNSLLKSFFRTEAMLLILLLLQMFQLSMHLSHLNYRDFLDSQLMFNFLTPLILSVMLLVVLIPSLRFIIKNYFRVKRGEGIVYDSLNKIKRNNRVRFSAMILVFVYLVLTFANIIFKGVPTLLLIAVILTNLGMWGVFYLFFLKVKKIKHSRLMNTLMLVVLFFVVWIGSIFVIFSVVANNVDFERPLYELPDVSILTYEDLGYDHEFEPEVEDVESTILVPLSFNYLARYEDENDNIYLNVEYVKTRFDWVQEMMIPLILEYEYRHPDESSLGVSEASIENDNVRLYKVRYDQTKMLIIKDQLMYIVTMNEPIKGELLDKVIYGLLESK